MDGVVRGYYAIMSIFHKRSQVVEERGDERRGCTAREVHGVRRRGWDMLGSPLVPPPHGGCPPEEGEKVTQLWVRETGYPLTWLPQIRYNAVRPRWETKTPLAKTRHKYLTGISQQTPRAALTKTSQHFFLINKWPLHLLALCLAWHSCLGCCMEKERPLFLPKSPKYVYKHYLYWLKPLTYTHNQQGLKVIAHVFLQFRLTLYLAQYNVISLFKYIFSSFSS